MNIVYTGQFRFPSQDAAAARVINNAKALRSLGHNVVFLSWGGKSRIEDLVNGKYIHQGFEYYNMGELTDDINSPFKKLKIFLLQGKRTLEFIQSLDKIDAIIAYNTPYFFTTRCATFCNKSSIPFVVDLTEWYAANEFPGGYFSPFWWINEWNMKHVMKRIENKLVISSFLNNYYSLTNNLIVPPLVDLQDEKWNGNENINYCESILQFTGRKILFAGNPAKKDLLRNVIEAMLVLLAEGSEIQLIIAGIRKEQESLFISDDERKGYENNFVFVGKIPQEQVPSYYNMVDFSVIVREPNQKNMAGFPTKMAESYGAGCPAILNATSDITDIVQDGKNAIVIEDYSAKAVAKGLRRILLIPSNELGNMKVEAKKIGENIFDYRNYISSFSEFFNELNQ